MLRSVRASENFHIVLWLLKDLCWVLDLKPAGLFMIVPTIAMAVVIAWKHRTDTIEFVFSLAVVFWILANSAWMIGEFYFDDSLRPVAIFFFVTGLLTVCWYYLVLLPRRRKSAV